MSLLRSFLGDKIREEMRNRVDEVLKAGGDWNSTAKELIAALDRHTEAIKNGTVDPTTLKAIEKSNSQLARSTKLLARAFDNHGRTLARLMVKIA